MDEVCVCGGGGGGFKEDVRWRGAETLATALHTMNVCYTVSVNPTLRDY